MPGVLCHLRAILVRTIFDNLGQSAWDIFWDFLKSQIHFVRLFHVLGSFGDHYGAITGSQGLACSHLVAILGPSRAILEPSPAISGTPWVMVGPFGILKSLNPKLEAFPLIVFGSGSPQALFLPSSSAHGTPPWFGGAILGFT